MHGGVLRIGGSTPADQPPILVALVSPLSLHCSSTSLPCLLYVPTPPSLHSQPPYILNSLPPPNSLSPYTINLPISLLLEFASIPCFPFWIEISHEYSTSTVNLVLFLASLSSLHNLVPFAFCVYF